MAEAKKGSRSGSSRSSGRSAKGKAKATRGGSGIWHGFLQALLLTFFGRALLALLAASLVGGLCLLVARDRFDLFYTLCAVAIIAFVAIGWLKLLLRPEED